MSQRSDDLAEQSLEALTRTQWATRLTLHTGTPDNAPADSIRLAAEALGRMHVLLNAAEEQRRLAKVGSLKATIAELRVQHQAVVDNLLALKAEQ